MTKSDQAVLREFIEAKQYVAKFRGPAAAAAAMTRFRKARAALYALAEGKAEDA